MRTTTTTPKASAASKSATARIQKLEAIADIISRRRFMLTELQARRIERLAYQLDKTPRETFDMLLDHAIITTDSQLAHHCEIVPCPIDDEGDVYTVALDGMTLEEIIAKESARGGKHYLPLQRIMALERGAD